MVFKQNDSLLIFSAKDMINLEDGWTLGVWTILLKLGPCIKLNRRSIKFLVSCLFKRFYGMF